jgi:hypothetical protein
MERSPRASSEQLRMSLRLRLEVRRSVSMRRAESEAQGRTGAEVGARETEARPRDS